MMHGQKNIKLDTSSSLKTFVIRYNSRNTYKRYEVFLVWKLFYGLTCYDMVYPCMWFPSL